MTLRVNTGAEAPTFDPTAALKQIISINPRASLHEIRSYHPALKSMSYDQLGVRLERVLDAARYDAA